MVRISFISFDITLYFKMSIIYKISLPPFSLPKDHISSTGSLFLSM